MDEQNLFGYIYLILNKVNGKTYIGQRCTSKEYKDDLYMGSGILLKSAKKKYGIENFEKYLLQICYSREELDKAEIFWIAEYRSRGKAEYNIADGGLGSSGFHHTEEAKRRIGDAQKNNKYALGKSLSEDHKGNISKSLKESYKNGKRESQKGKTMSEDSKEKNRIAHLGKCKHNLGKHWKLVNGKRVWYKN